MRNLLVLLSACLALAITACGDDEGDGGGEGAGGGGATEQTAPDESAGGGGAEAPAGGSATVDMKAIEFVPRDITVRAGTTITWTNSDDVLHTVTKTSGPGPQFDSGNVEPGGTYEQTFDDAGKVDYVCTIHHGQVGSVTVR